MTRANAIFIGIGLCPRLFERATRIRMAIASLPPPVVRALARMQPKRTPKAPSSSPLPQHHRDDLRDIALGVEETNAGICTKYLLDDSAHDGDSTGHLHDIERCLDRYSIFAHPRVRMWHVRIKRARRAINRMQLAGETAHVAILHIAFGAEDPSTREWPQPVRAYYGPELLSLVRYTDATEERRKRLVRAALVATMGTIPGVGAGGLIETRKLVSLTDVRAREAYHDRIITSGDALHEALSASTIAERPAFMTASKLDAELMLGAACAKYHRSWLASAS